MPGSTVLILVRDILGAGLLGALVEGLGKQPLFPRDSERPDAAVQRLRPALVLLDCYHAALRSDSFFTTADAVGSRIILFAPSAPWEDIEEIARRRSIEVFVHPRAGESLTDVLRQALSQ